jgi:hypothetical protein
VTFGAGKTAGAFSCELRDRIDSRPRDPDGEGRSGYESAFVRKGSIAAFIAAVHRLDAAAPDSQDAIRAAAEIEALLDSIKLLGVLDVFTPKSERARAVLRALDPDLPV